MKNDESESLSLVEAVETLSNIADLNMDPAIALFEEQGLLVTSGDKVKAVDWLAVPPEEGIVMVKTIFNTVLSYLRGFYKDEYSSIHDVRTLDGIKSIMVLVGEAAKKIDKFQAERLKGPFVSITESKEYKRLQDFYLRKISHTIDEGVLGKWILAITKNTMRHKKGPEKGVSKHVFIDLDTIKKDTEYELLLIRKEDGTRFFNPRIIRNIKLVSDFGHYFSGDKKKDILEEIPEWKDRFLHSVAKHIFEDLTQTMNKFYKHYKMYKEEELASTLNKCFIALMLAANPKNLTDYSEHKCSHKYFNDAFHFLKIAVNERDFQKLLTYDAESVHSQVLLESVLKTVKSFYFSKMNYKSLHSLLKELSPCEYKGTLSNIIKCDLNSLQKAAKSHTKGPIGKALEIFEEGLQTFFEPIQDVNIPTVPYTIDFEGETISLVRMGSPVLQEEINKAALSPAFKVFLRANPQVLIVNFQDRNHWREEARAKALDNLHVPIISWSMESDFYNQSGHFESEHKADKFKHNLKSWLEESQSLVDFEALWDYVHHAFFEGKNILSREERRSFIDLTCLLNNIKAIDMYRPQSVIFICKDGVDIAPTQISLMKAFFMIWRCEKVSPDKINEFRAELFLPALLVRERCAITQWVNRLINDIKVIEEHCNEGRDKETTRFFQDQYQMNWIKSLIQ